MPASRAHAIATPKPPQCREAACRGNFFEHLIAAWLRRGVPQRSRR